MKSSGKRRAVFGAWPVCVLAVVLSCLFGAGRVGAQTEADAHLRPAHRATVRRWLASRPQWRLAVESDVSDPSFLSAARTDHGPRFQPFYAVGDFNRDGREDFAVVLARRNVRRGRDYAVAIFNAPVRAGARPAFFADGFQQNDMLFVGRDNSFLIGPPESDNCFVVRATRGGSRYILKDCVTPTP